ncbi:hypothetical protein TWF694_002774 [Orbilia ellipsospora]|uniref:LysM domain-containing protein n=1 Tax=Orbilia ellipsospora TaxID=2528407 RepID=A0AAV9X1W9_9PEZI
MASEEMIISRRQNHNRGKPRSHTHHTSRYLNKSSEESEWGPSGTPVILEEQKKQRLRAALLADNKSSVATTATRHDLWKRRSSISVDAEPSKDSRENEDVLVYVHKVQPTDTLAGVLLIYDIEPAALRKANRLWPNDSIQMRSRLYLPVCDCAVKGVPILPQVEYSMDDTISEDRKGKAASHSRMAAESTISRPELLPSDRHHSFIQIDPIGVVEIVRLARPKLSHFPPATVEPPAASGPRIPDISNDIMLRGHTRLGNDATTDALESLEVIGAAIEGFVRRVAASARTNWVNKTTNDFIELTSHINKRPNPTHSKGSAFSRAHANNNRRNDDDDGILSSFATTNSLALQADNLEMPRNRRLSKRTDTSDR